MKRTITKHKKKIAMCVGFCGVFTLLWVGIPQMNSVTYTADFNTAVSNLAPIISSEPVVTHIKTPESVKALYMTQCVVGTPSFRNELVQIAETTEINSFIIDIKDFSGGIGFTTDNPVLAPYVSTRCRAPDIKEFISTLHKKGIYVIGRVTVFQDPMYANAHISSAVQKASDKTIWSDFKGIHFVDVGAKDFWDYIVTLSKESYELGFDEINFDYVRYPSDGPMKDVYYPKSNERMKTEGKAIVLRDFFEYINKELEDIDLVTSVDLFGMTTTSENDLNIGQVLEYALPYFDYVAPMVYPSHYPTGFNGWENPNKYPYEIVKFTMSSAVDRVNKLKNSTSTPEWIQEKVSPLQFRTWIQDFDYGGNYDVAEVQAQIQASYDAGVNSWMIWAPSNRYTVGALKKE